MNDQLKAIRAEIERLRKIEKENEEGYIDQFEFDFSAGYDSALGKLLAFIDSLPEETDNEEPNRPKLSDNLDKAAQKVEDYYDVGEERGYLCCHRGDIKDAFIAGAQWQKEQIMDEWLKDRDGCFWDGVEEGKKAMKEQMLKEAVEGEVVHDMQGVNRVKTFGEIPEWLHFGDKVRIIIVKEEQK